MSQVIDSVPSAFNDSLVCCYVNVSSKIQVARVTNVANWYFERVVFPGQRLVFEAPAHALLEIHCGMMASAILSDTIPCDRLRLNDEMIPFELAVKQGTPDALDRDDRVTEADEQDAGQYSIREFMATAVAS